MDGKVWPVDLTTWTATQQSCTSNPQHRRCCLFLHLSMFWCVDVFRVDDCGVSVEVWWCVDHSVGKKYGGDIRLSGGEIRERCEIQTNKTSSLPKRMWDKRMRKRSIRSHTLSIVFYFGRWNPVKKASWPLKFGSVFLQQPLVAKDGINRSVNFEIEALECTCWSQYTRFGYSECSLTSVNYLDSTATCSTDESCARCGPNPKDFTTRTVENVLHMSRIRSAVKRSTSTSICVHIRSRINKKLNNLSIASDQNSGIITIKDTRWDRN